ncbi:MAG: DUF1501 domain-containing protein [Bradyrhizobium sp.]|nr:MAG: DUF1501 domain-containing protein [Bradyrhizobium sp.]
MPDAFSPHLSRRTLLGAAGATFAAAGIPRWASAAGARDPRLVVVILRGALDGLSAAAPIGDPDYVNLHGALALRWDGPHPALRLDNFFGLNPAMANFARLYDAKQAMIIHATATNYRERSHFDGQDVLESGMQTPGRTESGWLNRAVAALPMGERASGPQALAVGAVAPLVMRGPAPILGWAPSGLAAPTDDLVARLMDLYGQSDPGLAKALQAGLEADRLADRQGMVALKPTGDPVALMRKAAEGAGRLMAADDGPRIGALAFDGWDTHANEGGATGRLAQLLGGLDGAFAGFESELGPRWRDTIVVAITEFGRTAHINGTVGTDHGTATVAFLAGGALAGGRVVADWPGLSSASLYERRDLKPTTDLRAVLKGVLADHLGLSSEVLARAVFPDTIGVAPMKGLIAA